MISVGRGAWLLESRAPVLVAGRVFPCVRERHVGRRGSGLDGAVSVLSLA